MWYRRIEDHLVVVVLFLWNISWKLYKMVLVFFAAAYHSSSPGQSIHPTVYRSLIPWKSRTIFPSHFFYNDVLVISCHSFIHSFMMRESCVSRTGEDEHEVRIGQRFWWSSAFCQRKCQLNECSIHVTKKSLMNLRTLRLRRQVIHCLWKGWVRSRVRGGCQGCCPGEWVKGGRVWDTHWKRVARPIDPSLVVLEVVLVHTIP